MRDSSFQKYSKEHVHFYEEDVSPILEYGLDLTLKSCRKPSVVDLGCGDGRIIFALHKKSFLKNMSEIVGVYISEARIRRLKSNLPFVKGIVSNASNVKELPSSSFDFVICSQLIEHVEDDDALVLEIKRLLKNGGIAYLSSVAKKRYGVYFYFKDGSFKLDPTHVREYRSTDEFAGLVASKGFEVIRVKTRQVMFPLLDLIIRLLVKFGLIKPDLKLFQRHKVLGKVRQLKVPIIGYKTIEVLARKVE
jgi:2-polyprenyl-3-methyl-5-hydroxy-6-metoxy-1,4-benzoquinol methylase